VSEAVDAILAHNIGGPDGVGPGPRVWEVAGLSFGQVLVVKWGIAREGLHRASAAFGSRAHAPSKDERSLYSALRAVYDRLKEQLQRLGLVEQARSWTRQCMQRPPSLEATTTGKPTTPSAAAAPAHLG
jgi:hypothetical protein